MEKQLRERDSAHLKDRKGMGGGGQGVDNLQTDFHAYYTNDFMIFDVMAAGVGRMQKHGMRGWGGLFSLSHLDAAAK